MVLLWMLHEKNLNLDEDTSAHRINAQLITLQMCDYLAAFSERAIRNELAVFDQNFNETIQNMTLCGLTPAPDDLLQAQRETEQEEGEEDVERQVVCKFEDFHDDTSLIKMQLRQQPREGAITAAYVNNKVVIKGPLGKPFEGGFEILRSGHLVYMDRVAQLDTVEGFTGWIKAHDRSPVVEISPICCQIMWGQKCRRRFWRTRSSTFW